MDLIEKCRQLKEKAELIFEQKKLVLCPYFNQEVALNSDGLHHLQFSARRERSKEEQILKFTLLPLAIKVIKKAGTVQEYRKELLPIGKKCEKDGFRSAKWVQSWGFEAIVGENNNIKIRTIIRQVGDGKLVFWSVILLEKDTHRLARGLQED
jgi:hypothetical protein